MNTRRSNIEKSKTCVCGNDKDKRSKLCAICSKKSFPILKEGEFFYDDEMIRKVILESKSILEAEKSLPYTRISITKYIKNNDISINHFRGASGRIASPETIFKKYDKRCGVTIKKYALYYNILENKCYECGLTDTWNNKPLTLQLHHINGDSSDNNVDNITLLCPNCHTQTHNFTGKNLTKFINKDRKNE